MNTFLRKVLSPVNCISHKAINIITLRGHDMQGHQCRVLSCHGYFYERTIAACPMKYAHGFIALILSLLSGFIRCFCHHVSLLWTYVMGGVISMIIVCCLPSIHSTKSYMFAVINHGKKIISNTILLRMQRDELLNYVIALTAPVYIVYHCYWMLHLLVASKMLFS